MSTTILWALRTLIVMTFGTLFIAVAKFITGDFFTAIRAWMCVGGLTVGAVLLAICHRKLGP